MKINKSKIIIVAIILLLFIMAKIFKVNELVSFEAINNNLDLFKEFVHDNVFIASVLFVSGYTIVVALALPIATVLSLVSGLVMGVGLGVFLVVVGATLGASINFLLTRYLLGENIQRKYANKLTNINEEINKNGKNYLLTLRLIPLFPFFLINIAAGLSNVKFKTFFWTTSIGIIPGTFAYVYLGTSLNSFNSESGLPNSVIVGLVLIGLMALLPVIYKKYKKGLI